MSRLVVITFDNVGEALQARQALDMLDREYFELIDAAVVTKQSEGRVEMDNESESSTRTGALLGAVLGAPLALILPGIGLVALVLGAVGGGLIGKAIQPGVEQSFAAEVTQAIKTGGSALIFMFDAYEKYELPDVIAVLRPFKSTVYQTTLSYEGEQALRRALA